MIGSHDAEELGYESFSFFAFGAMNQAAPVAQGIDGAFEADSWQRHLTGHRRLQHQKAIETRLGN
ncbi:MAG: hypothetical protein HY360_21750 [Verrucomicrobia bacterium]|nr:hypothetical protein [Verrucomicrobiota bacterium]